MEPFIAEFINNKKIPKSIRIFVLVIITIFIEYICIDAGLNSKFLLGKVFAFFVLILFIVLFVLLIKRIIKK